MSEIQQSPLYGLYMKRLKWHVILVDSIQLFVRPFFLIGGIMKIHRPEILPDPKKIIPIIHQYHVRTLVVEPVSTQNQRAFSQWCTQLSTDVSIHMGLPYLPTKTIKINLTFPEQTIFKKFTEAKQRAVRRAQKHGVTIRESTNINDLIRIKNKSAGLFGHITTTGIFQLWDTFTSKHASILLAYHKNSVVGGVLLMFWDNRAYYWIAGATPLGKQLFAPTLLLWEAIRISKQKKCRYLDLVGVWDERIPKQNRDWLGFTKFKEGFGGEPVYYPLRILH